jgi:hypothetical protein
MVAKCKEELMVAKCMEELMVVFSEGNSQIRIRCGCSLHLHNHMQKNLLSITVTTVLYLTDIVPADNTVCKEELMVAYCK